MNIDVNNKGRKITLSVIAILLCLISLVGVTLALFTSGISDGKIGINVTSGKVSVDIEDAAGNSLVGEVLDFVSTSTSNPIYWEPGATFVTEPFKITNESDIPINYHLFVNNGANDSELVDVLEFYITTDPSRRETVGTLDEFKGELGVEDSSDVMYYLVVHMKETAGNKYQGLTLTGVGVTVYAVQGNVEIQ